MFQDTIIFCPFPWPIKLKFTPENSFYQAKNRTQIISSAFSRCDVAKEDDWTILWEHAETFFKDKVSILVNNAGVNPGLGWKACIDVMLLGVGFGTFQAIEKMGISKVCTYVELCIQKVCKPDKSYQSVSIF